MKRNKRLAGIFLTILVLVLFLPVQALAAGSIDLNREVSLTISYQNGDTPLSGAAFDLHLVATVDEAGELTPTEEFAQYNINLQGEDEDAWKTLASTLEGYVLRDNLPPIDSGVTDEQGQLSFPTRENRLTPGLYLVLGHRHIQDGYLYDAQPFLVLLPSLDEETNDWLYDVTVKPKHDVQPEPEDETITRKVLKVWKDEGHENDRPKEITVQLLRDGAVFDTIALNADNNWRYTWTDLDNEYQWTVVETELEDYTVEVTREGITFVVTNTYDEDTPDEPIPPTPDEPTPPTPDKPNQPTLPQTGQLWWPVLVLIAAGLLLIVLGLLRRRGAKK